MHGSFGLNTSAAAGTAVSAPHKSVPRGLRAFKTQACGQGNTQKIFCSQLRKLFETAAWNKEIMTYLKCTGAFDIYKDLYISYIQSNCRQRHTYTDYTPPIPYWCSTQRYFKQHLYICLCEYIHYKHFSKYSGYLVYVYIGLNCVTFSGSHESQCAGMIVKDRPVQYILLSTWHVKA